ncbi:hypothetical protein AX15_001157 [Amanita polypyramis BW_CC]|nr:hypothetical protein AX15_001157 [Amanita polypyramis BW_CC]
MLTSSSARALARGARPVFVQAHSRCMSSAFKTFLQTTSAPRVRLPPSPWSHLKLARSMFIQTETTPNEDSLKFIPGVPVMGEGTAEFLDTRSALVSPLAIRLMGVEGVAGIFFGPDFVTVSKDTENPWAVIKPEVYSIIMEHFTSGQSLFRSEEDRENAGPQDTRILDTDSETVAMIKELLETRVRPAIMEDGGDIEYRGFGEEDGVVQVKLKGSCRGCDSSTVTLKSGIERMLMHYVPEVKGVEQVLDEEEQIALDEFNRLEQKLAQKEGNPMAQYMSPVCISPMVYANDKKFACESCIKGHRSSSCHHADRPLFEIKKKGRPVSQCEKCRQLRQSKRVHTKCICNPKSDQSSQRIPLASNGTKSKRFIPVAPALPNGLKDLVQDSQNLSVLPPDVLDRVDSLLNPCKCDDLLNCECQLSPDPVVRDPDNSLDTLAVAAAICCGEMDKNALASTSAEPVDDTPILGVQLPPIQSSSNHPSARSVVPNFPIIPPLSAIASLAGTGCTCGLRCACPGCIEHRGTEHALPDHKDCADGCGTCVDERTAALPISKNAQKPDTTSILDRFFAHAATLPAPRRRGGGVQLDPMNVTVYPDAAWESEESAVAFGLVHLPKLECCAGRCSCPDGRCGCGRTCNGACSKDTWRKEP